MAVGDLNDGSKFGLPAIGLDQAHLDTPGSDTERRAMPGLATKSSVFAWNADHPVLLNTGAVAPNVTYTINLRQNAAVGGSSVDVPTWAAGAIVSFKTQVTVMGTTLQTFDLRAAPTGPSFSIFYTTFNAVGAFRLQVIIPFFDEPTFTVVTASSPAAAGTVDIDLNLLGFVRNV